MRRLAYLLVISLLFSASTASALPFMKDLAGDKQLPRPWGLGIDFYTMDQDYEISNLEFVLPGVGIDDPSLIDVTNDVQHLDLKADVWLFPFLNVFGLAGRVDANTIVDFSKATITGLPFSLGELPVSYDGSVYGLGFTLAYGSERWFTSVTTAYTKTSVSGDLDSKVDTLSIQPRIGLVRNEWVFWAGGMYLDVDESHSGIFELPFIGGVPFAVDLVTKDNWNYALGARYHFGDRASFSFEYGFGNRKHTLANLNVRF